MRATIRNIRKMEGRPGVVAACPIHPWERFSATPGDYFMAKDSDTLTCPECGDVLVLARFSERMIREGGAK